MGDDTFPSGAIDRRDPLPTKNTPYPKRSLNVNYSVNPTELYKSIESKDWDATITICKQNSFQAKTWVSRYKKKDPMSVRWKVLPIHAAIIFKCPVSVMKALLIAYPDGLKQPDDQGMLPIHLAFRSDTKEDIVSLLTKAYPKGLKVKDSKGRSPLTYLENSKGDKYMSDHIRAYSAAVSMIEEGELQIDGLKIEEKIDCDKKHFKRIQLAYEDKNQQLEFENKNLRAEINTMTEAYDNLKFELKVMKEDKSECEAQNEQLELTSQRLQTRVNSMKEVKKKLDSELKAMRKEKLDLLANHAAYIVDGARRE